MVITAQWLGCLCLISNLTGATNQFVDLSFDPASGITTCLFLRQPNAANSEKTCSIQFGYGILSERCEKFSYQNSYYSRSSSDKVYLGFPEANHLQSDSQKEYCFTATASNGTFTISVEGTLYSVTGIIIILGLAPIWKWIIRYT